MEVKYDELIMYYEVYLKTLFVTGKFTYKILIYILNLDFFEYNKKFNDKKV